MICINKLKVFLLLTVFVSSISAAAQKTIVVHTNFEPDVALDHPILVSTRQWLSIAALTMDLKHAPIARALKQTTYNPNTLIIPLYRLESREQLFQWFCPFAPGRTLYLYRKSHRIDLAIEHLEQAKHYKIGGMRGTIVEQILLEQGFNQQQLDLTTYGKTNFTKLVSNRVDFIAQSAQFTKQWLSAAGLPQNF